MSYKANFLAFPVDTPGLTGTIQPIHFFDDDFPEFLPVFDTGEAASEAIKTVLCAVVDKTSDTELEDGFYCEAFCATPEDNFPGYYFGRRVSLNVRGRHLTDDPNHPYRYTAESWREEVKETVLDGWSDSEVIRIEDDWPFVFTEEVFNHDSFQEFEEMLETPEWPKPFDESRDLWQGYEANLLCRLRGLLTAEDPIIMRTLSLDAFLTFADRWGDPDRFVDLIASGPGEEDPMPLLYEVNEKAWKRWVHKKAWLREQDGRIIRSIEINDLLEIFPHKAQCFRRRSGEERFEALLEGGLWAEGQIRNTIRNRLANTSFDAVTGELLLDEEPTTPDIVFHGIVPGRITENEGPDWIQQRRRSKAELREKRRIRKERREQKLKA